MFLQKDQTLKQQEREKSNISDCTCTVMPAFSEQPENNVYLQFHLVQSDLVINAGFK